jgi:hypothetical protein
MGLRVRVVLVMALVASGGLMAGVATAASKPKTSVSLQFASHDSFKGRLSSSKASCVRSRVVRLEKRKGRKWVSVATARSNHSGRFQGTFHGGAGQYRALAAAKGSCALGTSRTVAAPTGTRSGKPGGPGSGTSGPGGGGPSPGGSGPQQPTCSLPLTHDPYDGFHIAVPAGWELFTLGGELEVEKDALGSEAVVVAPAAQTSGLTPASYFQSQLGNLESQLAAGGTTLTVTGTGSQNGIPSATFTAPIAGQAATGQATVLVEPLTGQAGSTELVFAAYWAPSAAFGGESSLLSSVANCYGPETASLYRIYQDAAFTYMLPPGWTVPNGGEGQDNLNLVDSSGDIVAYQATNNGVLAFNSPQTLIDAFLNAANVTGVTKLWAVTPSGGTIEYEEFTATFQGRPVHGLVYGQATNSGGFYSGTIRIGLAQAGNWNAVNGALIQMAGAIQHNFTQDLETINQLNQQWQSFSNQVADFDDILNNQQLTQDPTTGIFYDAPYDSYEVDGPNGPGYYNDDQKLNIINRQ